MTSTDQAEITQSLIKNNAIAAQLWLKEAAALAQSGNAQAQAVVDFSETDHGKRVLWALNGHINLAIASCAFDLPSDDQVSHRALVDLVKAYPHTRWVIEQHLVDMPLDEVNPELVGNEQLLLANERLTRWLSV